MGPRTAILFAALAVASACGRSHPLLYEFPPGRLPDGGFEPIPPEKPVPPETPPNEPPPPIQVCLPVDSEKHELPPATKKPIDILFIIDDSCSMANDQAALGQNFDSFIASFNALSVDFHMGVVTTDMRSSTRSGRLVAPFLTPQTPDIAAEFSSMVRVGTSGSGNEQGIAAAHAALTEPLLSGSNKGFLRSQADFALVIVTDENDHSTSPTTTQFIDFLKALKPDPEAVTVAAILGLQPSLFCPSDVAAWRYTTVAKAFGARGVLTTCQNDYATTLSAIGGRITSTQCLIGLKQKITDPAKVRVTLNGGPATYVLLPPDEAYPQGALELIPCPAGGGTVEIQYLDCKTY